MRYARVALPLAPRRLFTYEVPEEEVSRLRLGQRVLAPFGRRTVAGTLVGWEPEAPVGVRLRRLEAPAAGIPPLPGELLELTRWAADYYLVSWGSMIEAAAPVLLHLRRRVSLWPGPVGRTLLQGHPEAILEAVLSRPGVRLQTLQKKFTPAVVARELPALERAGLLVRREELVAPMRRARPPGGVPGGGDDAPAARCDPPARAPVIALTEEQRAASAAIRGAVRGRRFAPFLLRGVTGSGKTEVYLEGVRQALEMGLQALFLVPEIGLTPLLAARLRAEFGLGLAVLHSGLGSAERADAWRRIASGEARLALGTRSAIFAPLTRPGFIVVDEEQDPSYKQDEAPRYQARDLALVRARQQGIPIVLGSATPSLETNQRAVARKIGLLELRHRIDGRPLPEVEIIDMRRELGREGGRGPVLSKRLVEALGTSVSEGAQAILLLNRRGYASCLICRACGEVASCRRCSVGMTLHRRERKLRCHYCGDSVPEPEKCANCGVAALAQGAEGTERLEAELEQAVPGLRSARLDSDTVRGSGARLARTLSAFERGELQVLLGTQIVAKGHDFPNVTLVGVLCADGILGLPDFRAAERTYQLIHQVSGRAGRGGRPGRVIVQTFAPEHYAVRFGARQDYDSFFTQEARYRRGLRYPPFTVLAQLLLPARDPRRGSERARHVAERLRREGGAFVRVLGPALAPLERLRGRYRFQILVKANNRLRLNRILSQSLAALEAEKFPLSSLVLDVDPASTL